MEIMEAIKERLASKEIPIFGIASAAKLDQKAPEGYRPCDVLEGARSVIILAKPLPLQVFLTKEDHLSKYYTMAFTSYYGILNEAAISLSLMFEDAGHLSMPLPSYSPVRYNQGKIRGVFSFKHAAVEAGIGKMGKHSLLIHPDKGTALRLGGLLTTLELTPDLPGDFSKLCPDNCHKCEEACPVNAIDNGAIDQVNCMSNCINHSLIPPRFIASLFMKSPLGKSALSDKIMEIFTLSFVDNYGIKCFECLKVCPHFPGHKFKARSG